MIFGSQQSLGNLVMIANVIGALRFFCGTEARGSQLFLKKARGPLRNRQCSDYSFACLVQPALQEALAGLARAYEITEEVSCLLESEDGLSEA